MCTKETKFYEQSKIITCNTNTILFWVVPDADTYSIQTICYFCVKTNNSKIIHKVIKNWMRKNEEEVFKGKLSECYNYIKNIAENHLPKK